MVEEIRAVVRENWRTFARELADELVTALAPIRADLERHERRLRALERTTCQCATAVE